ncbi:hypothetical protein [Sandaracinus amylolyticus]|uniref:hypothetical protein n=1 Tax=Sandaracinus amylolyticus TaxID=927083 RepID=UPI001F37CF40|nr:hypothetical protein [Sandaracinus amylolyticus]
MTDALRAAVPDARVRVPVLRAIVDWDAELRRLYERMVVSAFALGLIFGAIAGAALAR